MNEGVVICPLCGHRYIPVENAGCQSCPLKPGCGFACCPECGYEYLDISKSALVRWITSVLEKLPGRKFSDLPPTSPGNGRGNNSSKLLRYTKLDRALILKGKDRSTKEGARSNGRPAVSSPFSLLDASQSSEVIIQGFTAEISHEIRHRLQAYGLAPGVSATVLQTAPVVIVQIENLELVLEPQLARNIQISRLYD
ncbi:MAG TPA: FeoA domain-containing protein [Anaerolineales bacterium]|nr:FeoA domain-containing protein [Anaerolineales bacterium]